MTATNAPRGCVRDAPPTYCSLAKRPLAANAWSSRAEASTPLYGRMGSRSDAGGGLGGRSRGGPAPRRRCTSPSSSTLCPPYDANRSVRSDARASAADATLAAAPNTPSAAPSTKPGTPPNSAPCSGPSTKLPAARSARYTTPPASPDRAPADDAEDETAKECVVETRRSSSEPSRERRRRSSFSSFSSFSSRDSSLSAMRLDASRSSRRARADSNRDSASSATSLACSKMVFAHAATAAATRRLNRRPAPRLAGADRSSLAAAMISFHSRAGSPRSLLDATRRTICVADSAR